MNIIYLMKIEDKFAFIGSDINIFKRSTDASFSIFNISPSVRKAFSEITSAFGNFQNVYSVRLLFLKKPSERKAKRQK